MNTPRMNTAVPLRVGIVLALVLHLVAFMVIPEPSIPEYIPSEDRQVTTVQQDVNLQVDFQAVEEIHQEIQQPQDQMMEQLPEQSGMIEISEEGDTLLGSTAAEAFEVDTTNLIPDEQTETSTEYVDVYEVPPRPVHLQEPVYPRAAQDMGIEGTVILILYVDIDGSVTRAEVLRSDNPLFDDAAVEAGLKCRFTPAESAGRPIRVKLVFPVNFRLN